ncbi:MAG TPA: response regulator [Gammaproteobacteria bacterium]|nr:response regulator [Gammaproteobacteria bacterium]
MLTDKTLLFVDDDPVIRTLVAETLRATGVNVFPAESALHALEMLESGLAVDAVITDYCMPGMTGTEFAERLGGKYPLLLISSDDLADAVSDKPEITHFQRKPLSPPVLLDCVKRILSSS